MKKIIFTLIIALFVVSPAGAQTNFNPDDYLNFLKSNENLSTDAFLTKFAPKTAYYNKINDGFSLDGVSYLDSIKIKFNLSDSELGLLGKNRFVVSERMSEPTFYNALVAIYNNDLPVFVSTDVILETVHLSYDKLLSDLEMNLLKQNLKDFLGSLYNNYYILVQKYGSDVKMHDALADADLYITMVYSLLEDTKYTPHFVEQQVFDSVWDAVKSEKYKEMPLFSDAQHPRNLDFSQFTVRGHYTEPELAPYFRCMMWLGRVDFFLTKPPDVFIVWGREDIKRMTAGALLLNELINNSAEKQKLVENDEIITFMVGESDNLTLDELTGILTAQGITAANEIFDDTKFDSFQKALIEDENAGQKILSDVFMLDPFSTEPDTLPVSYRVMGQKFIIDSYIFSNVVFSKTETKRMMPSPLDASFALGNDDALPLLKDELDKYEYSSHLIAMRYLVDAYDNSFWDNSMYNTWLNSIRKLNPLSDKTSFPLFMRTSAWGQEKLNTQLGSWAELRHDNLLYAKQSYTGGVGCSFPHSYVEPYPDFYHNLYIFADKGHSYFSNLNTGNWIKDRIINYFSTLKNTMLQLESISAKELSSEDFSADDIEFLKQMLYAAGGGCGAPSYTGWLFYLIYDFEKADKTDYVVADVHTQPTDEEGNMVGRVLHVGVGKPNLGVFITESPSNGYTPMAYIGPVMSYYEKITDDFKRLTDETWTTFIQNGPVPDRPDWVNIYLADSNGSAMKAGRELPGVVYTIVENDENAKPEKIELAQNFPNPFNPRTTISYQIKENCRVNLTIYDMLGRVVKTLVDENQTPGYRSVVWDGRDIKGTLLHQESIFTDLKRVVSFKAIV